jgi:two-component system cell cycle response regulator DivK
MQILVVEDDAHNRELIVRRLRRRQYDVGAAADGDEALELCAAALPALILMDIALPGISGLEVMRCLRESVAARAIPIIVITSDESARAECLAMGCMAFIVKPIDFAFLVAAIEALGLRAPEIGA